MKELNKYFVNDWEETIQGVVLFESDSVICLANNPVDYVIDGLTILNKKKIRLIEKGGDDLTEKIMDKKLNEIVNSSELYSISQFSDFRELFLLLHKKGSFSALGLSKEGVMYIGKVITVKNDSIDIDFYTSELKLLEKAYVEFQDITYVTINSDYVQTIESFIDIKTTNDSV